MNYQAIISHLLASPDAGFWQDKIFYGQPDQAPDEAKIIIIPHEGADFSSWLLSLDQEVEDKNGTSFLSESLPVQKENGRIICSLDIIQLAHFFLTRQEEIARRDVRDQHGRFPGRESLPFQTHCLGRPLVDEYGALLRAWLRETGENIPDPPRQISKIYLTHDVDSPFAWQHYKTYLKATIKNAVKHPGHIFDPLLAYFGMPGKDPLDCFDWILEQDNRLKQELGRNRVESIFFFMAGGQSPYDALYDVRSPRIRKLMARLQKGGATIGLHVSYEAGMHPELITREAQTLRQVTGMHITKSRHHFLACREPEHLRNLADAGITDDFTLAYADHAGFRMGTCRPYKWFDPVTQKGADLTIHPLTTMECTLDRQNYMNLDYAHAYAACTDLLEQVKKYNGEAVLLWHNTQLTSIKSHNSTYHPRLYIDMLNWLKENAV